MDDWGAYVNSSTITEIALAINDTDPAFIVDDASVLGQYLSEAVVDELMAEAATAMGIDWIKAKSDTRIMALARTRRHKASMDDDVGGVTYKGVSIKQRGKINLNNRESAAVDPRTVGFRACILGVE